MSANPYGYLVFEIGEPDKMVYFTPTKYKAHWFIKTLRCGESKDPDKHYLVRCKEESFVRIPWEFEKTWGC